MVSPASRQSSPLSGRKSTYHPVQITEASSLFAYRRKVVKELGYDERGNARHPVNSMLNYGYAVLISQIAIELAAKGFDLSIGIAHSGRRNPKALVYDFMEPLRPVVDRQILQFALARTFTPGDFTINQLGGCRLNPQLAKVVTQQIVGVRADLPVTNFPTLLR